MPESAASPRLEELPIEQLVGCPECDLLMAKPTLNLARWPNAPLWL